MILKRKTSLEHNLLSTTILTSSVKMAVINPDSLIASAIPKPITLLYLLTSPAILYITITTIYNIFFHPLAKYPGPLLARASRLWYLISLVKGDLSNDIAVAHSRYGDVMRIAPDELCFLDPAAWKDIYSHRAGKPEMVKDPVFYAGILSRNSILDAPRDRHGEMRRLLSHGFSASALREQYPIIESYVQLLVDQLAAACDNGKKSLDIVSWWNVSTKTHPICAASLTTTVPHLRRNLRPRLRRNFWLSLHRPIPPLGQHTH